MTDTKFHIIGIIKGTMYYSGVHMIRYFLFFIFILFSFSGRANFDTECFHKNQPLRWSYCISRIEGSTSKELLYYLHGVGGNEYSWSKNRRIGEEIGSVWMKDGVSAPIVIAVSFGKEWILNEKNSNPTSGLMAIFIDQILPSIEKNLGALKIGKKRLLFGESMGGINSAELVLKHPELFSRAAIACPVFTDVSPFASDEAIRDYIKRTNADPMRVKMLLKLARRFFPDEESWATASPLDLAKTHLGPESPALHISCGDHDEFGVFGGAHLFSQIAEARKVSEVHWQPLKGGHCVIDPEAIARFLLAY